MRGSQLAGLAWFPALVIGLRLGTKRYVIGHYMEAIQGASVVVPPCGLCYFAAVLSRH